MSEKYYKVSLEELYSMLHDQAILECLEVSGVDNWEGYGGWDWDDVDTTVIEHLAGYEEIKNA